MEDDDIWRIYLLVRACRSAEHIEVEGVWFNLEHPNLERSGWEPVTILGSLRSADPYTPRLLFPWSTEEEKSVFERRGEGVVVRAGDTVRVATVKSMGVRAEHGRLGHPQHRERRWALLEIVRASGAKISVAQAWEFQGSADVMTPIARRDYKQAKHALHARMRDALGLDSIDDLLLVDSPAEWPEFAETATELDRLTAEVLWAADSEYVEEAAMVFGYLIGRAEARELLLPHAERQIEQSEQRRGAAKQPRKAGNETRAAALAIISSNPGIIRRKCAELVATERGLQDVKGVERTINLYFAKGDDGRYRPTTQAVTEAKALVLKGT
ncbi:MAG TPA: hypothetical protein PLF78_00060 [Caulobacter sp.]|nr:hypothetical protein [Caulobacter sp.]